MSDVGDLLELLYGASDRWSTVHATIRSHHRHAIGERATQRWLSDEHVSASRLVFRRGAGAAEQPETIEHVARIWFAKPDGWRQESDGQATAGRGRLWWTSSPHYGFLSNEDEPEASHSSPRRWRVDAMYHPAFREQPETLHLLYNRDDARAHITVAEPPRRPEVLTVLEGGANVETEREGTFISISSESFGADELRRLADGLVRV